jgi:hypothetical protein
LCFEKFYDSSRSLTAVLKNLPIIDSLNYGNKLLTNPKDIALAFNNHYSNIIASMDVKQTGAMLYYTYITPTETSSLRWK